MEATSGSPSRSAGEARALAAVSYLAFSGLGMAVAALGPALPFLARNTGSSLAVISNMFIAQNVAYMLGSYFGGQLYDRLRGTRLMAAALLLFVPVLALVPLSRTLAMLLPIIALLGFVQGVIDVGGNVLMLRTPAEGRSVRMNALHLFFGVGAFLAPLIMAQAVRWSGGISWGYWALALLSLPAGLWMLRLPTGPRPHAGAASGGGASQPWQVALVAGFIFLAVAAEAGFGSWIYTYALTRKLAGMVGAAYLTSVFWGFFAVGRLASTLLSLRWKPRRLILASLAGCLAAAAALLAWPRQPYAAWIVAAAFGLSIGPLFANAFTLARETMTISGRIAGIILAGMSLGGMFLPWLIGQLFEPLGPAVMPAALLLDVIAAAGLMALFLLLTSRRGEATASRRGEATAARSR
jgi:FHS family Na+ dependent glucose MFS transporter 1